MRRILRKIAAGEYEELGDITTLADPAVVEKLVDDHRRQPYKAREIFPIAIKRARLESSYFFRGPISPVWRGPGG